MSIFTLGRLTAVEPRRQHTAEQAAEVDVDQHLVEERARILEAKADQAAALADAAAHRGRADAARARLLHPSPDTPSVTAIAVFGAGLIVSAWALGLVMFRSMGIPFVLAVLLAGVEAAAFSGGGSLALLHLPNKWRGTVLGCAILLVLTAAAVALVPVMAQARADEIFAEQITDANAKVAVLGQLAGGDISTGGKLLLDAAQQQRDVLPAQRDTAAAILTVLFALTLLGEVVLSGYAYDGITRLRARRLDWLARRCDRDAAAASDEVAAGPAARLAELGQIARRHALDMATIDRLARTRDTAHVTAASAMSPQDAPAPTTGPPAVPPVGPTAAPTPNPTPGPNPWATTPTVVTDAPWPPATPAATTPWPTATGDPASAWTADADWDGMVA